MQTCGRKMGFINQEQMQTYFMDALLIIFMRRRRPFGHIGDSACGATFQCALMFSILL